MGASCVGDCVTFFLLEPRSFVVAFTADVVLLTDALVPLDTAAVHYALAAVPATAVVPFLTTAFGVDAAAAAGRCVVAFFFQQWRLMLVFLQFSINFGGRDRRRGSTPLPFLTAKAY